MSKKNRSDETDDEVKSTKKKPPDSNLKSETMGWIIAVVLFAVSLFLLLASISKAGVAGQDIYSILSKLFGIGYFLLPILCIAMGVSFARSFIRPVSKIQYIGASIFFLSSLALVDLSLDRRGGIVGGLISQPLLKLFDIYASVIILLALSIVSILIIVDAPINLNFVFSLFKRKEEEVLDENEIKNLDAQASAEQLAYEKAEAKANVDYQAKSAAPIQLNSEKSEFNLSPKINATSKPFHPPPISLLEKDRGKPGVGDIKGNANIIKRTLQNFGIIVEMDEVSIGPSVTRYALKPAEGVKLSKILGLQNNLELALAAHPVRIEAPIPGKSLVGIEIPNSTKTTVGLATLFEDREYRESPRPLLIALGKGISGETRFGNLGKMPHLLIAGATGSGKSVTIHTLINSLLFRNSPESLKFIMIDPKRVELTLYNKIPHLLTPVITDAKKTISALKWAAKEMESRYNTLEGHKVRDIESYHKNVSGPETMPYIVIIIDELADIMQAYPRELESAIVRLAQMSRAVGIHLVLSTQRPSVNIITGLIKANIPARVALQVASQIDSRTILDMAGAEKLLGAGDMLFLSGEMSKPIRLQSAYISEAEVKKVTEYLAKAYEDELPNEINLESNSNPDSIFKSGALGDDEEDDDLYGEAKEIVIRAGRASTSFLQRKLRIGYARAARLMDILEEHGVIGPGEGAKPRDVLIKPVDNFSAVAGESFENGETNNAE